MATPIKTLAHIKSNRLFDGIPESDLKVSINQKDIRIIPEGDIIYQTGDSADVVYLILEGAVKIKFNTAIDGQRIFEKMRDDFFGEREFIDNTVRVSSAVANTDCHILTLRRKELNDLISRNRVILNNLQGISLARSSATTDTGQSQISPELDDLLKTAGTDVDPFSKTRESFQLTGEFSPPALTSQDFSRSGEEPVAREFSFGDTLESPVDLSQESDSFSGSAGLIIDKPDFSFSSEEDIYEQARRLAVPDENETELPPSDEESFSFDNLHEEPEDTDFSFSGFGEQNATDGPSGGFSSFHSTGLNEEPGKDENTEFSWDFADEEETEPLPATDVTDDSEQVASGNETLNFNWEQVEQAPVSYTPSSLEEESGEEWNFSFSEEETAVPQVELSEDDSFFSNVADKEEAVNNFTAEQLTEDIISVTPKPSWKETSSDLTHISQPDIPLIPGEHFTPSLADLNKTPSPPNQDQLQFRLTSEQLRLIINAAEQINSNIKIDEVLKSIVLTASQLTGADRGTLYIVDNERGEIWSKVIRGENIEEIRLRIGQGLSGWVAQTGEIVNIKDAHSDERFDSNMDKITGYITKSVLCFPIINKANDVVAVLQLLNSSKGFFDEMDESFLAAMSLLIAITLENAELVEQIVRTDRLTSLGKVANFIISDIKKPILTAKQLSEHLKKKQNLDPEVRQAINLISDQVGMVSDLIVTVLNYSQGKTILNKKIISGIKLVDEIIVLLGEYLGMRGIKVIKSYGGDSLINVDKKELYQAVLQIAKNACDAMPGGGTLTIAASTDADSNTFKISLTDTGLGVPGSLQEKIFEPFMCHGKKHGVGLGLSIAEKIAKEHGGSISLVSEVGEGATFTISLPVVKGV